MLRTKLAAGILCLMLLSSALRSAEPVSISLPLARPMAVAYSPDGKQIAVGGLESGRDINSDGMILLLDSQSGKERAALRHSGTIKRDHGSLSYSNLIHELSYSPDGRKLAVAAQVGLKLWNPADGKELATLVGYGMDERDPQVEVTSVAFSPDGKLLAVARSPIELWDVASRKPLRQMESPGETHVTFSSDGSLLVSVSYQNRVHLWSVADGKHLAEVHADMGPLYGVAVDRQSKHVAAVGGGEKLWRIKKDAAGEWKFGDEARLTGHFVSTVRGVAFSPDGRLLATNGYDRHDHALVIYDARTREPIGTLLPGGPFAFSPDGNSLAVAQQLVQQVPGAPGGGTWYGGTRLNIWKLADLLEPGRLAEQARTAARDLVQTLAAPRAKSPFAHPGKRMMHGLLAVLSGPQGEAAAPILADALKNPQVHEKQLLLLPLQRIAGRDATARAAIIEALRTAEAVDVRAMALSALSERPGEVGQELRPADWAKEAVPALVEAALNDENPRVRGHARGLLSKLDPQALQQAAETAQARGPMVDRVKKRGGKLFYQGRPLEEWIKRLSVSYIPNEIFGRPSPDEPLAAIRAIGPDAVPVLLDTLKNGETEFLRRAAAAGLAALGPQAAPTVEPLLEVVAAANAENLDVAGGAADALALILKER
jgi:HEAT repeat protein/DNA-binding beta-propeller fold protein YncE